MNEIQVFEKEGFGQIRITDNNGEPWFVAKDIAEALGYSNPSRSVQDHCKYVEILKTTSAVGLEIPSRGLQIIPESDLYRLIMRSKLESAESFQDWVVEEVLPSIRKKGSYEVTPKTEAEKLLEAFSILTAQVEHEKTLRLEAERTKAMIGDKKVATALVTASHAVRKANKLEKENDTLREMVGDGKDFKQVKALPWLKTYFNLSKKAAYSQVGKALSAISRENGYEIREIENSEYPHPIKAYSVKAIEAFLYKIHADESYLKKYRII